MDPLRVARAIKLGIGTLFIFGGFARLIIWGKFFNGPEGILTSLLLLSVGLGIWLNWRWARWLAMGACFLCIVLASGMPLWLLLLDGYLDAPPGSRVPLVVLAFAATFAYLGYKGLQYFGSDLAHQEYRTRASDSKYVVYAAALNLTLAFMLMDLKIQAEKTYAGTSRRAPASDATPKGLPDLLVNRLCLHGDSLVKAEIENLGAATAPGFFSVSFTDLQFRDSNDGSAMRVPSARGRGLVTLSRAINPTDEQSRRLEVTVEVDPNQKLDEHDEHNNVASFVIEFDGHRPANLPPCKSTSGPNGITSLDPE